MKKFVSSALILVMVFAMLSITAFADEPFVVGDLAFSSIIKDETYSDKSLSRLGFFYYRDIGFSNWTGLYLPENATITVTVGGDRDHIDFAGYTLINYSFTTFDDLREVVYSNRTVITEAGTHTYTKSDLEALIGDFDMLALCVSREKLGGQLSEMYDGDEMPIYVIFGDPATRAYSVSVDFTDMVIDDYFALPVAWALKNNITAGTSATTFSPNDTCTTAQILTFLWRSQGSPEPAGSNTFSDVSAGDYYYKTALWAGEKGLVSGTAFNGNTPCTRKRI